MIVKITDSIARLTPRPGRREGCASLKLQTSSKSRILDGDSIDIVADGEKVLNWLVAEVEKCKRKNTGNSLLKKETPGLKSYLPDCLHATGLRLNCGTQSGVQQFRIGLGQHETHRTRTQSSETNISRVPTELLDTQRHDD